MKAVAPRWRRTAHPAGVEAASRRDPLSSDFTSTCRSPLSQVRRSKPSRRRGSSATLGKAATVAPGAAPMASKISPVAESPASMPVRWGSIGFPEPRRNAGTTLRPFADGHDAGESDYVTTWPSFDAGADRVPMRVKRAHRTGCPGAAPACQPTPVRWPAILVGGLVSANSFFAHACEQMDDAPKNLPGRPPSAAFHIHL